MLKRVLPHIVHWALSIMCSKKICLYEDLFNLIKRVAEVIYYLKDREIELFPETIHLVLSLYLEKNYKEQYGSMYKLNETFICTSP